MSEFEIRSVPRQDTAVVRVTTTPEAIAESMGQALSKAYAAATSSGGAVVGPPFTRYFSFGETIDYEAGVPVAAPFEPAGDDEVKPAEIGGGEAAVAMHVGPYDTISETWEALSTWVETQGRKVASPPWEAYLTDPSTEPDPANWRTEVYQPLE